MYCYVFMNHSVYSKFTEWQISVNSEVFLCLCRQLHDSSSAGSPDESLVPALGSILHPGVEFTFLRDLSRIYSGALVALKEEEGDKVTFRLVEVVRRMSAEDGEARETQFVVKAGTEDEKLVSGRSLFVIDRAQQSLFAYLHVLCYQSKLFHIPDRPILRRLIRQ